MTNTTPIHMYGLGGYEDHFKIIAHWRIDGDLDNFKGDVFDLCAYKATRMRCDNPSVEEVYAIYQKPGLAYDYQRTVKKNDIEFIFLSINISCYYHVSFFYLSYEC